MQHMSDKIKKNHSVVIAGAGLSGLCLAQGLLQEGFDVQIYERDSSAHARKQGYRITIDEHGARALKQCLPSHLFEAVLATASPPSEVGYFRFTNERLGEIFSLTFENEDKRIGQVDRATLRTIMLSGIEDRVHFDNAAERVEINKDGGVLYLADGSAVRASVIIGAEGIHSSLREQLLPDCPIIDTGSCGIYGKTSLKKSKSFLPPQLENSGVMAMGNKPGRAFFFTSMRFNEKPKNVFARWVKDQRPPVSDDYIMWAVLLKDMDIPGNMWDLDPGTLHQIALKASAGYHPVLQGFVKHADVDFTIATKLSAATEPDSMPVSHATLLGDAVHVMPPTGAHGGNTALRDAASLYTKLRETANSSKSIEQAIGEYQEGMLDYAFKEVKSSIKMLKNLNMSNSILRFATMRLVPGVRSLFGKTLIS
jgi:2-polyprenyl-6-methoxyphenol hydroxylase-like FAD-dependent oxidoreductase